MRAADWRRVARKPETGQPILTILGSTMIFAHGNVHLQPRVFLRSSQIPFPANNLADLPQTVVVPSSQPWLARVHHYARRDARRFLTLDVKHITFGWHGEDLCRITKCMFTQRRRSTVLSCGRESSGAQQPGTMMVLMTGSGFRARAGPGEKQHTFGSKKKNPKNYFSVITAPERALPF